MSRLDGYNTCAMEGDGYEAAERHYGELMALPDLDARFNVQRSNSGNSFTGRMRRAWDTLSTRSLSIQSDSNARASPAEADDVSDDVSDDESVCSVCIHEDVEDTIIEASLLRL
jgi:hypothetical protein